MKRPSISSFVREKVEKIDWTVGSMGVLEQLKILAITRVPNICHGHWNYHLKRKRFDSFRFMKKKIGGRPCCVCGSKGVVQRHHIIALINGGVSIPENMAAVCKPCHQDIHGRSF